MSEPAAVTASEPRPKRRASERRTSDKPRPSGPSKPIINPTVETARDPGSGRTASAGTPTAPAQPEITVDQARENYDDLIAEMDREVQRTKDTGRPLPNEDWVEYYRRGHEAMDPLRRLLGYDNPEHKAELEDKAETLRNRLEKLQMHAPANLPDADGR